MKSLFFHYLKKNNLLHTSIEINNFPKFNFKKIIYKVKFVHIKYTHDLSFKKTFV